AANTSTSLPVSLGNLAAGSSANATLNFPATAGTSGHTVTLKVVATFNGGSSTDSLKVRLP
ncbi:MAG TPA: hypothetical protein VKT32_12865, partial [Chthonomonadaceae bacterium]|nr:hypothetical protein [Chthonomonadaceae bacterium]